MPKDKRKYLHDIKSAVTLIETFLADIKSFDDYQKNLKTKSAVERQLSIVGEAVIQYAKYDTLKNSAEIKGFRNRLIHAYDSIDDTVVWVIVKRHLPLLSVEVSEILKS